MNVVRLVADGLTNRQIGERLFISRRTVETHVSHVFTKLDVSSHANVADASLLDEKSHATATRSRDPSRGVEVGTRSLTQRAFRPSEYLADPDHLVVRVLESPPLRVTLDEVGLRADPCGKPWCRRTERQDPTSSHTAQCRRGSRSSSPTSLLRTVLRLLA